MRFLFWALLFLTGCAAQTVAPPVQTLVYDCEGGFSLTAREAGESLWLFLPSGTRQLTASASDYGRLYTAAGLEFWKKGGEEAGLRIAGQHPRTCRRDQAAAIWEDAKFRGVDFRAAGNEPGWFVELDREQIIYAGNYGRQLLSFPAVAPQRDDRLAETRYVTAVDDHKLDMLLQVGDCRDSMSGELFSTRVTLNLDGQTRYGCGRSLH